MITSHENQEFVVCCLRFEMSDGVVGISVLKLIIAELPAARRAAERSLIPIQKGEPRACMEVETRNPCNSFFMSKWLAAWIAGACAQRRRRRRRRTTWRPYFFLPLIPSFSLQLSSLIFDIHVTNNSRC